MPERDQFMGFWVSKQEKEEIRDLAKGMGNISISDLIRHRVIRPMMTIPEAISNLKLYIDTRFKKFEHKIIEIIKTLSFERKLIQHAYTEEIEHISISSKPSNMIIGFPTEQVKKMNNVLKEMKQLVKNGELILEDVPKQEKNRKRPKTDQVAYEQWKAKKK